jgi:hypothetical protein
LFIVCILKSLKNTTDFDVDFLIVRMIQEEGLYVYNIVDSIAKKHFSVSIAPEAGVGR